MKKFLSTTLIVSFYLSALIQISRTCYELNSIQRKVKQNLNSFCDHKEIKIIKFSQFDVGRMINWKDENEFEFQGRMYDVISSRSEGDTIIYNCYDDKQESVKREELKSMFLDFFSNHQSRKSVLHKFDVVNKILFPPQIYHLQNFLTGSEVITFISPFLQSLVFDKIFHPPAISFS